MNRIFRLVLALVLLSSLSAPLMARVSFQGTGVHVTARDPVTPRSLSYMTAEQMAAKVQTLTGFYQSGFEDFKRIIGTYDPVTGSRTNDKPTVLGVLILDRLFSEVANNVVAREIFLDKSDRIVFRDIDLSQPPNAESLGPLTRQLCLDWFAMSCPPELASILYGADLQAGKTLSWEIYLSTFLQNGSLYYL